jgi:hypothetical protein
MTSTKIARVIRQMAIALTEFVNDKDVVKTCETDSLCKMHVNRLTEFIAQGNDAAKQLLENLPIQVNPSMYDIIRSWMTNEGYDGFFCQDCKCTLDDGFMKCYLEKNCKAGYLQADGFTVGEEKP